MGDILSMTLPNSTDGLVGLSADGVITNANDKVASIFGYTSDGLVGVSLDELLTEKGRRAFSKLRDALGKESETAAVSMHHRLLRAKTGSDEEVTLEVSLLATGGDGDVLMLVRDVTARDRLRESRLLEFLDILPFPIMIFGRHPTPQFVNKDAMSRFRIGSNDEVDDLKVVREGDSDEVQGLDSIERAFDTGQVQVASKLEWVLRNGRRIPFNLVARPFEVDESGVVRRVVVIVSDTSDIKQRQKDNQRRVEAEAASRAKSKFLANISHEIRTPLNAMLGFQQLVLQKDQLDPMDRKNVEMSLGAGVGLMDLLNNILDIARIDSGAVVVEEKPFEVENLRRTIEKMFVDRAREAGLKFSVRTMDNCPATLTSDQDKIRQILSHLVANALNFTREGEVRVILARHDTHLLLEVADTGPGIDEARLETLFEPFQPHDHENAESEGSGLGLAICKSFVDALDGTIELETEARQGACFKVQIPVPEFEHDADKEKESGGVRVLVVDDSDSNRQLLHQLLTRVGYEFFEAVDGVEAIEMAMQCRPHIVLMDLQMPRMDGYQAAQEIKSRMDTKIVAVSANVFDGDIKRAEEAGIDGFVKKPFRLGMILDVIEKNFEEEQHDTGMAPDLSLDELSATQKTELRDSLMRADPIEFKRLLGSYDAMDRKAVGTLSSLVESYRYQEVIDLLGR